MLADLESADLSEGRDDMSGADGSRPRRRLRRPLLTCGCAVMFLIVVLLAGLVMHSRTQLRASQTPEEWARLETMLDSKLELSEAWHQPAPLIPGEVLEYHLDLYTTVTSLSALHEPLLFDFVSDRPELLVRMSKGEALTAEEETSLTLFLEELQPALDRTVEVLQNPGYTAEVNVHDPRLILTSQIFAKFINTAALDRWRKGDHQAALQLFALPLKLSRREVQAQSVTHMVATAVASMTVKRVMAATDKTSDTALLQQSLEMLSEHRPAIFHDEMENWKYGDTLGKLTYAAANGYPADLKPRPYRDISRDAGLLYYPQYYQWVARNLPKDDLRVEGAREYLRRHLAADPDYEALFSTDFDELAKADEAQNLTPVPDPENLEYEKVPNHDSYINRLAAKAWNAVIGLDGQMILHSISTPSIDEMLTRTLIVMTEYDLVRTRIATRISALAPSESTLANGIGPASPEPVARPDISSYLLPEPQDPFGDGPFRFSRELQGHYSVGPDGVDNSASLRYDVKNGTLSAGDIWMDRP